MKWHFLQSSFWYHTNDEQHSALVWMVGQILVIQRQKSKLRSSKLVETIAHRHNLRVPWRQINAFDDFVCQCLPIFLLLSKIWYLNCNNKKLNFPQILIVWKKFHRNQGKKHHSPRVFTSGRGFRSGSNLFVPWAWRGECKETLCTVIPLHLWVKGSSYWNNFIATDSLGRPQRFRVDKVGRINRTIEDPRIFVAFPSMSPQEAGGISKFRASEYRDNPCVFRVMCSKALPKVWFRATAARVVQQWPIVEPLTDFEDLSQIWATHVDFQNLSKNIRQPFAVMVV